MRSTNILLLTLIISVFSLTFVNATADATPADCQASMVSYIQFNGNDKSDIITGGLQESTQIPNYATTTLPNVGVALDMDQSGGFGGPLMYTDPNSALDFTSTTGFTLEFWWDQESTTDTGAIADIPSLIHVNWDDGMINIDLPEPSVSLTYTLSSGKDGAHHYAITYTDSSSATQRLKLYIDGTKVADSDTDGTDGGGNINSYAAPIQVNFAGGITGYLDEIAFFNKPLTTTGTGSINDHYSASSSGDSYCEQNTGGFSSVSTEFIVDGCTGTDVIEGTINIPRGSCSRGGRAYCPTTPGTELAYTVSTDPNEIVKEGCDFGDPNGDDDYTPGDAMCCPTGYICVQVPGGMTCEQRDLTFCGTQGASQGTCEDAGCFWFDDGEGTTECVDSPSQFGCGIYSTQSSCVQDTYNLGGTGVGTEACDPLNGFYTILNIGPPPIDEIFVVPQTSCECKWDTTNGCELSWNFQQALYASSATKKEYECRIALDFEECVDGQQTITWTARTLLGTWTPPIEAYNDPGCVNGQLTRSCGEPIIKLPGFSNLALISAITLLTLFYFARKKDYN